MPCTKFKSNGTINDDGVDITNKSINFHIDVGYTLASPHLHHSLKVFFFHVESFWGFYSYDFDLLF